MGSKLIAVIVICAIVATSSTLIASDLLKDRNESTIQDVTPDDTVPDDVTPKKTEYSITYVLNGGTNSGNNLEKYTEGVAVTLNPATKEDCVFKGWYLDENFSSPITAISKSTTGDLTLYAKWAAMFTVTYNMMGHGDAVDPVKVEQGKTVTEPSVTSIDGTYILAGWYTSNDNGTTVEEEYDFSTPVTGDLTLYAYWEESEIGKYYTYSISGSNVRYAGPYSSETPITGSITYTFLTYRYGQGYFIGYDETVTSGTGRFATTNHYSEQYWSGESDNVWTRGENATISTIHGSKECSTWVSEKTNSRETQYVGLDNDITYIIQYVSVNGMNTYSVTYTLTDTGETPLQDEYTVDVYCDKGIAVTGAGTIDAFSKVTLTASGQSFAGWYSSSGTLLSNSDTYEIDTLLSDIVVYARNNNDRDLSFTNTTVTVTPDVALTDVTWTFVDNGNDVTRIGNTLNYTFSSAGTYVVLYTGTDSDGNAYHGLYDIFADGVVTKTYSWSYGNHDYTASLEIGYSDFLTYRNDTISRFQGTTSHDLKFVTYEDQYIVELVGQIQTQCAGETDAYIAGVMLAFTQYIEYQYDSDSMGTDEYWKYPLETLFDENGDCEDTSILFCAMAKAAGYDCALIIYSGHMAAGINIDGISGNGYYSHNNVRYYYCETTSIGWNIGDTPNSSLIKLKIMTVN